MTHKHGTAKKMESSSQRYTGAEAGALILQGYGSESDVSSDESDYVEPDIHFFVKGRLAKSSGEIQK